MDRPAAARAAMEALALGALIPDPIAARDAHCLARLTLLHQRNLTEPSMERVLVYGLGLLAALSSGAAAQAARCASSTTTTTLSSTDALLNQPLNTCH